MNNGNRRGNHGSSGASGSWGGSNGSGIKKKGGDEIDPPLFPERTVTQREAPQPTQDDVDLITRHRDIKERFRNVPTFLKMPNHNFDVQRYSDKNPQANDNGCSSLSQVLLKPLPFDHFPDELHSVIQPVSAQAAVKHNLTQRFKRKVPIDLNKLEAIEKRAKETKEEETIERKLSINSGDASFDEDGGDYGIDHYASDPETFPDEEEATF